MASMRSPQHTLKVILGHLVPTSTSSDELAARKEQLKKAKELCKELAASRSCAPILVRTAWHDSGTYDKANANLPWPDAGGAVGSIITDHEIHAPPNAGLKKAVALYLKPIKDQVPLVSWADLIQMASATAIEVAGGPKINMRYGRLDGVPKPVPPPFGLPDAKAPFGGPLKNASDPAEHLRYVFYKYGMTDGEIVALSGAHTLGRAFKDRSGTVEEGYTGGTKYTAKGAANLEKSETAGGRSWTKDWLKFDNSYFTDMAKQDQECIAFETDKVLMTDPGFRTFFADFANSQESFFSAYAAAHKKLSELGSKFEPAEGISGI